MKTVNINTFDANNFSVDNLKVSGFDVIITDIKGETIRIADGLPEILLGNIKLKHADGQHIETSDILKSIDASKLGLDVAVVGGLIEGSDVKGEQKGTKLPSTEDTAGTDKKQLDELLDENKKLKEKLAEAEEQREVEKAEITSEPIQTVSTELNEQPQVQAQVQPAPVNVPKRKLPLEEGGGSSSSGSAQTKNANSGQQENDASQGTAIPLSAELKKESDTGIAGDNITADPQPVFTGKTAPLAEVLLTIGGSTYTTIAGADGSWKITVSNPLPEGSNTYTVSASTSNGVTGILQGGIIIDTQSQEVTVELDSISDTGVKGDFTTQVQTPTLSGTAEAEATLILEIGGHSYTFSADASGRWNFTLPDALGEGVHNYTLTSTDKAGNSTATQGILTIDTTGPLLNVQLDESNNMLMDNVLGNNQPTFSGSTEPGLTVTITIGDKTYQIVADGNGNWSFTVPVALENKTWEYTVTATDAAGNQTFIKDQVVIQHQESVETLPLTGGLDAGSDSGVAGDKITSVNKPVFSGTTVPGASVTVSIAGNDYTATADLNGNWEIEVTDTLPDGVYDYTITATGANGDTGTVNNYLTVDTELPYTEIQIDAASDSGVKGDNITNVNKPLLTGTTEPNAIVKVVIQGVEYETKADSSGQWNVQVSAPLSEGNNSYTVTVTDAAGNSSSTTGELILDSTGPSLSGIKFVDGYDDRYSNTYTPTIGGWAEAGSTVYIQIGSRQYSVTVPSNRQWQFKVPAGFITEGNPHQYITFIAEDAAGNRTQQTIKFSFITDKPIITADISVNTDTDIVGDKITSNNRPTLTGTIECKGQTAAQIAMAKVTISINGKIYENISVSRDGKWTFALPDELVNGNTYNYTITVTDFVGNTNTYQSYVTISTLSGSLDAGSITGLGSDQATSDVTPTLSGKANAGSMLTILINNKNYQVQVGNNGQWSFKIPDTLGDGKYDYKITESTTDGKTNTFSGYFVVDTKAPQTLSAGLEEHASGAVNISNRPDLTLKGKTEALALVTIVVAGVTYQTLANEKGEWSYTFDKNAFSINTPYNYTVTASDAAGNKTTITGNFTIDTITVSADIDDATNSGNTSDNITNNANPKITGVTAPDATITLVINGKTYNTTADSNGHWSITIDDTLGDNTYSYTVTAEKDGKVNYATGNIVIDTSSLTPTHELDSNSDSGVKNDHITNVSTPTLTGKAEAGATITVTLNGTSYTTIAADDGTWSLVVNLQEGVNHYTVMAEDKAGNMSEVVEGEVTLDSQAPATTSGLVNEDNSGDTTDTITNVSTPSLMGKTEPGVTVTVEINSHVYTTIAGEDGSWTIQIVDPLNEGRNEYTVTVEDIAGNQSQTKGEITLDTTAPVISGVKMSASDDADGDGVTETNRPTIEGKVDEYDVEMTISFSAGGPKYPVDINSDGTWSYQHPEEFAPGKHEFILEVTDKAGNTSSSSGSFEVVSPGGAPLPFEETTAPVEFEGVTQAGSHVQLSVGDDMYSTLADESGKWAITSQNYSQGNYAYSIQVTTPSGDIFSDKGEITVAEERSIMEKPANNHDSSETSSFFVNAFDATTELSNSEETL
ncbi:Ig-like domain-containing protein [Citrobacter freundii]|uniref:Ig-like domain-containing protein n=1 Tax=Citrobacter freundii TaxID=546 RepID=UPI00300C7649